MVLEQRTVIDQIEITRDGVVQLRLSKQVLRDGEVVSSGYHRALWEPGAEFKPMADAVDANLIVLKEAPVEPEEWARVEEVINFAHKKPIVAAYLDKQLAMAEKVLREYEASTANVGEMTPAQSMSTANLRLSHQLTVDVLKEKIAKLGV